jgi:predicted MFS family arabinose efflux permease
MSKVLPDDAEAGGGLMVAVIQLSITLGASVGGLLFDSIGYRSSFGASVVFLCLSAVVALLASRRAAAPKARNWRRKAAVQTA